MVSIVGKITESYIKDQVRQGGHKDRIIALYRLVYDAAREQFSEDNKPTLDSFLLECFEAALRPIGISKFDLYELLIKHLVQSKEIKQIAIVLPTQDRIRVFKEEFWKGIAEVPLFIRPMPTVDSMSKMELPNCTIRFISNSSQMRGIRIDQVYYSAHLSPKQKEEMFVSLRPCVPSNENMIEFY
jgi:hypothetical protein